MRRSRANRAVALDAAPATTVGAPADAVAGIARAALIVAVIGAGLAVDPFADAAFDAPKRLVVLIGVAVAAIAWLAAIVVSSTATAPPLLRHWRTLPMASRVSVSLAIAAAVAVLVSALASPYPAVAWPTLRVMALGALLLVIGASRLLDAPHGARFAVIAAVVIAINAAISLMQAAGWTLPLPTAQIGGRFPTGALLGNEGYVALASAVMGAGSVAVALHVRSSRTRVAAIAAILLAVATIAVNRQATAAIALAAAVVVIVAIRSRLRWMLWSAAVAVALALITITVPAIRDITWNAGSPTRPIERYQSLTTYRLGAWIAALDMIGARPLAGSGPGSYAVESTVRRLDAEIRLRERMVQPVVATFVRAHNDYLQLAAESGLLALALVVGALGFTIVASFRVVAAATPAMDPRVDAERAVLLAVTTTVAVAAIAWFPMHIPLTAMLALLACGRLWRLGICPADVDRIGESRSARAVAIAGVIAIVVVAWPEFPRYRAERLLAEANARIESMFRGRVPPSDAQRVAGEADRLAVRAGASLSDDPRPWLASGIARLIERRPQQALEALQHARSLGERPEVTINIGRARGVGGDAAGAHRAFVRTAWINPAAVATLPAALRRQVLDEVSEQEARLVRGELDAPPPLD